MNEPKRLSEGGGDRLGALSLRAARRDAPPRDGKQRALVALGVAGAAGLAGGAAKAAVPFAFGRLLWSVLGVGVVSAGVVAGGVALSSRGDAPSAARAVSPSSAQAPARPESVASAPASPLASATVPEPQPEPAPAPVVAPAIPSERAARPTAPSASAPGALSEELAALDVARTALAQRSPAAALRALDRYRTDFPRGFMGQEATVLRIEALVQQGERAGARELARRFVDAHPQSPVADRVRSLGGL